MSKRKRRNKLRPRPDGEAAPRPVGRKRSQKGLLLFAIVLLAAVGWLNYRRSRDAYVPPPLPLPPAEIDSQPLASATSAVDQPRFSALTPQQTGVDFVHPVDAEHPYSFLYFAGMASGGMATGDIDGDNRPDLYVVGGPGKNKLYRQLDEPFRFEDITERAQVDGGDAWGCGATMVDINGDGRLDIFVANYDSPNLLYINQGDGRFAERAGDYGLNIKDASLEGVFADYDCDGDLDLYLLTYRFENPTGMPKEPPIIRRYGQPAIREDVARYYEITNDSIGYGTVGRSDGLLRNNGDETFTDVSLEAGIQGQAHGQSATWLDYNDDGFPDLFVGNDFKDPDCLYQNNGDGTFTDVIRQQVPHTTWFSMGSDSGDVNGDGRIDLLTADMSSTTHFKQKTTMGSMSNNREFLEKALPRQYMRNALLLNSGTSRFMEAAYLAGLDSTDWTWAIKLLDLDCDGRQDVFVTNGSVRSFTDSDRTLTLAMRVGRTEWDIYKDTEPLRERNLAFQNLGNLSFRDVSAAWGVDHQGVSMATAHADFDGDGDLDMVVANVDEPLVIYRNNTAEHHRISIRLHGRQQNRFGIGARVRLRSRGGWQVRELHPSRGFLASNQPVIHFGLGDDTAVDELVVQWPGGKTQQFHDLPADHHYVITEAPGEAPGVQVAAPPSLFSEHATGEVLIHEENAFDDYELQPLLPYKLSQLGPSLAVADIDGDGDDDLFLGGAAGKPGRVAVQETGGGYRVVPQDALDADRAAEDMGAVWLDSEGDGDLDLLVLSGGNETEADAQVSQPRLYLLDGQGVLHRAAAELLPSLRLSGGPVAAADFDRDGDTDLFLGGRQVPGRYPSPCDSYLLTNEAGRFTDATARLSAGLAGIGMVTGALWTDVDNDGWLDLMLSLEWGGIHLFRNRKGVLENASAEAGLTTRSGWWSGITSVDADGDGDLDYITTNLGLNTKYHASDEHPLRMYYGDFDGSGEKRLVEAEYEDETLFPMRGKSCSTHAMPFLADKFKTYRDFAVASLQDIYTTECLDASYQCSANELATGLLLNDGAGHFEFRPLPMEAQLSPGFGVIATDATGDGIPDVFIAQNFFAPQPETGNMDGGLGVLLRGRGDGTFEAVSPSRSGIVIAEDATAVSATDVNADGRPDFVVASNKGRLRTLARLPSAQSEFLAVRLAGVTSSSQAAGARIEVSVGDGPKQLTEVAAGSGYLSQQSPVYFFGRGAGNEGEPWNVTVIWPDGQKTVRSVSGESTIVMPPPP